MQDPRELIGNVTDQFRIQNSRVDADTTAVIFITVVDLSEKGGASVATKEMINAFGRNNSLSVSLICPEPTKKLPPTIRECASNVVHIPERTSPGSLVYHGREQATLFGKLLSTIRLTDPGLIVSRISPALVTPPILAAAFRIPYVPLVRGWLGVDREVRKHKFMRFIELTYRLNFAVGEQTYVPVKGIGDEVRQMSRSIDVCVFPNAVNPELFVSTSIESARQELEYELTVDDFVVGFVGSLGARHRISELMHGFAESTERRSGDKLMIVGGGNKDQLTIEELRATVSDVGIEDDIIFTGPIPHDVVPVHISACDVMYGVSDPNRPTAPIKLFEYLACERPVITTQQPELAFVSEQQCGYVIPEIDSKSIATAIDHYRAINRSKRLAEGARGREYVKKNHTWDRLPELVLDNC